mmetsp:Transcript_2130/g.4080  ORF Transcript_2130/g.4080 Transcript_2130/m.4080 type:complete len:110 (+) Transcript_2130:130-459(+)
MLDVVANGVEGRKRRRGYRGQACDPPSLFPLPLAHLSLILSLAALSRACVCSMRSSLFQAFSLVERSLPQQHPPPPAAAGSVAVAAPEEGTGEQSKSPKCVLRSPCTSK